MYVAREIWKITFLFEHSSYIPVYASDQILNISLG